jgi:hypothetical protein
MMPAYNAERFIGRAVDSVLAQSLTNWELVIVDDGSVDRTGAIAAACASDPRVRVIHQANRGEAAARNVALDQMTGEFVAFLDADDLFLPGHLGAAVAYLQAHPEHAGVYSDGYYISEGGRRLKKLSARRRPPVTGRVFDEVVLGPDLFGPPLCVVLRRRPIRTRGLRFDENIVIGPDWDFFVRYADEGLFGYIDQVTCLYCVHEANLTVQTGVERRCLELAKCRANAVHMAAFAKCPLDVRVAVFYDLLVVLLRTNPEEQQRILDWPEFLALPANVQGCLLRLMASKAILFGGSGAVVREWLQRSRRLSPMDSRGALLSALHRVSPTLCRTVLRLRTRDEADPLRQPPFKDLDLVRAQ